jgi:hypothetical protein
MKSLIILPLALCLLLPACAGRNGVKLTPEQTFELVKSRVVTATNGLALLISELEKRPGVSLEKLRIWKQVHALAVVFISEVEDVKVIDLSSSEGIRQALDTFLGAVGRLMTSDVDLIADIRLKGEISAAIHIVREAIEKIAELLPKK